MIATTRKKTETVRTVFDLAAYPMYHMAHILQRYDANMATDLQRHGLSHSEWRILATLQYRGELTIKDLAAYSTFERSFVGRFVAALEDKGLVRRRADAEDRRVVRVTLTEAGMAVFTDIMRPIVAEQLEAAFRGISESEKTIFLATLAKMTENVYRKASINPPELGPAPG